VWAVGGGAEGGVSCRWQNFEEQTGDDSEPNSVVVRQNPTFLESLFDAIKILLDANTKASPEHAFLPLAGEGAGVAPFFSWCAH
jgi:hypothetical protein